MADSPSTGGPEIVPDEADRILNISEPRDVYALLRMLRDREVLDFRIGYDDYYTIKFRDTRS